MLKNINEVLPCGVRVETTDEGDTIKLTFRDNTIYLGAVSVSRLDGIAHPTKKLKCCPVPNQEITDHDGH